MSYFTYIKLLISIIIFSAGIYSICKARHDVKLIPFAMIPFILGLMLLLEEMIRYSITIKSTLTGYIVMSYLFFADFFLLAFIPFSLYLLEQSSTRKTILKSMIAIGLIFGLYLYVPLFLSAKLSVIIQAQSMIYMQSHMLFSPFYYEVLVSIILITSAFFISSYKYTNILAVLALTTGLYTYLFNISGFISSWCFYMAIFSLIIVYAVLKDISNHQVN